MLVSQCRMQVHRFNKSRSSSLLGFRSEPYNTKLSKLYCKFAIWLWWQFCWSIIWIWIDGYTILWWRFSPVTFCRFFTRAIYLSFWAFEVEFPPFYCHAWGAEHGMGLQPYNKQTHRELHFYPNQHLHCWPVWQNVNSNLVNALAMRSASLLWYFTS